MVLLDQLHGLDAVGSLRTTSTRPPGQAVGKLLASQLFVVDDKRGNGHAGQKKNAA